MKNTNKRPYQKPVLIHLGKFKFDKEAFEKGELGETKVIILRKLKGKKDEFQEPQE